MQGLGKRGASGLVAPQTGADQDGGEAGVVQSFGQRCGVGDDIGRRARIGMGRDDEVILELSLITVIDQIDAVVDLLVANALEGGNAGEPVAGFVAGEIIHFAR